MGVGVLNYDTSFTAKSSKTAKNHSTINELETTTYIVSKWQYLSRANVLDNSLARRQNTHVPGYRFFPALAHCQFVLIYLYQKTLYKREDMLHR